MMNSGKIYALYFSATGNTKKIVKEAARTMAKSLGWDRNTRLEVVDISLPDARSREYSFSPKDIVVVGAPTYAGKLPNKILPFFQENIKGNGATAIGIVTFGNRSFDNSLAELCATLEGNGFKVVGAAAMVGEHPFSYKLGTGRPNETDICEVKKWIEELGKNIDVSLDVETRCIAPESIPGEATAPYYIPKQVNGEPAVFLKAKPKTDTERCNSCGQCSQRCPMGSIDKVDPTNVTGVCIKCQACVKGCPTGAKFFDDEMFLSHVKMLELNYTEEKKNYYIGGSVCFQKN